MIHLPYTLGKNIKVYDVLFDCPWDEEAGVAVKFEDNKIEVGSDDIILMQNYFKKLYKYKNIKKLLNRKIKKFFYVTTVIYRLVIEKIGWIGQLSKFIFNGMFNIRILNKKDLQVLNQICNMILDI